MAQQQQPQFVAGPRVNVFSLARDCFAAFTIALFFSVRFVTSQLGEVCSTVRVFQFEAD